MKIKSVCLLLSFFIGLSGAAFTLAGADTDSLVSKAPANAKVYFISLKDGQKVTSPFKVTFGLSGMGVAPAGVDRANTGHHHLLINLDKLPNMAMPLPANDNLIHFGGGQTETEVKLAPGKHTLQLLLGNYLHVPHDKPIMSDKITVIVK